MKCQTLVKILNAVEYECDTDLWFNERNFYTGHLVNNAHVLSPCEVRGLYQAEQNNIPAPTPLYLVYLSGINVCGCRISNMLYMFFPTFVTREVVSTLGEGV